MQFVHYKDFPRLTLLKSGPWGKRINKSRPKLKFMPLAFMNLNEKWVTGFSNPNKRETPSTIPSKSNLARKCPPKKRAKIPLNNQPF